MASTIPESALESFGDERGFSTHQSTSSEKAGAGMVHAGGVHGFDDDDLEFQKALEMSLLENSGAGNSGAASSSSLGLFGGVGETSTLVPPFPPSLAPTSGASSRPFSSLSSFAISGQNEVSGSGSVSPLGSTHDSIQASTARARALLEQAQREQRMAEEEGGFGRGRRGAEDEEEEMRRAIEESLKNSKPATADEDDDDEDYVS